MCPTVRAAQWDQVSGADTTDTRLLRGARAVYISAWSRQVPGYAFGYYGFLLSLFAIKVGAAHLSGGELFRQQETEG